MLSTMENKEVNSSLYLKEKLLYLYQAKESSKNGKMQLKVFLPGKRIEKGQKVHHANHIHMNQVFMINLSKTTLWNQVQWMKVMKIVNHQNMSLI